MWDILVCTCHETRFPSLTFASFNKPRDGSNLIGFISCRVFCFFLLSWFKLSDDRDLACIFFTLGKFRRYTVSASYRFHPRVFENRIFSVAR
jgi:hypothetical protein